MEELHNVLVIGGGGREHALAYSLHTDALRLEKQGERLHSLYCLPGNPGMAADGIVCLPGDTLDFPRIREAILAHDINLVVVGPEAPLVAGLRDYVEGQPELAHVWLIGPGKLGANLEGSKIFAKQFMGRHGIPTANFTVVTPTTLEAGIQFLQGQKAPYVLKADGLAAGKGVLIVEKLPEAIQALKDMLEGKHGDSARRVVIEEFMPGQEVSAFALVNGTNYQMLPEAQDYKRAYDGGKGPNTGGMGAVSPVGWFHADGFAEKVRKRIVEPTLQGLQEERIPYLGFIFFGLMRSPSGDPYVVEYNARMGDPETQAVLPRISGLLEAMWDIANGQENGSHRIHTEPSGTVCVSLVSGGYPGAYPKGKRIQLPPVANSHCKIFHAGTSLENGHLVTAGGRVLSVCGFSSQIAEARRLAYGQIETVHFDGMAYRHDIGEGASDSEH